MSEDRRPAPAGDGSVDEARAAATQEELASEADFFHSDEHDGWAPIARRRPTEPPEPPSR